MNLCGYRTRAYPTAAQAAALRMWVGHQRFIYNSKVREADYWRSFGRRSLSLTGQVPPPDQAYSQFIGADTAFLRDVPSQVLRNGAYGNDSSSTSSVLPACELLIGICVSESLSISARR